MLSLWHFGWPWGSIVAPWASILSHMGCSWESFGHFGETLGLHFGALGLHLGTLGVHVGVLWALWGVALDPSGHFCGKCLKKAPKMDAEIKAFPMRFCVFVESGKQRLDCACAVGLGFRPLVFNLGASIGALCFFNCFLTSFGPSPGPQKVQNLRVGVRACTQLFDFKNKALVYLYLDSLLPLRYGAFYMQPDGSSLDPRPDLRRLRRTPGRGWFVCVFS